MAPPKEPPVVAAADATGRWQLRIALVSAGVAIVSSLLTLWGASAQLRGASNQLDESVTTAKAVMETARPLVPVGTVIASLLPPEKFEQLMGSIQESAVQSVWVLADGRDVPGSVYAKLSGAPNVPDLRTFSLTDAMVQSGDVDHGQSLLETLSSDASKRTWHWPVSLREADPKTPFVEREQRLQRLTVLSDDPRRITATTPIFDGKQKRWVPETPTSANFTGVSVVSQPVHWYIKISDS